MSETACRVSMREDSKEPASSSVWSTCFWIGWGALGGTALIALDRDWISAAVWLLIGAVVGIAGPRVWRPFYDTFDRLWDNPHKAFGVTPDDEYIKAEAAKGGLIVAPAFGLFHGFLLGPFLGVLGSWQYGEPGWSGALTGLAIWSAWISTVAAVVMAVLCTRLPGCAPKSRPPRWMYAASPLFAVPALVNCARALIRLPRQRRIVKEFTARGADFGWDGNTTFFGINLRRGDFTDADLKALRSFPDIVHLDVSGTRITDAGLAYVLRLRRLQLLGLSRTQITDEGALSLSLLTSLRSLNLSGTAVTEEAVAALRSELPRCRIVR